MGSAGPEHTDPAGKIVGPAANVRESGQRTGAEAMLAAMVDSAIDGLITIDERGNVESFNRSCQKIFGYAAEEVIGRNIKVLMPEPYHGEHDGYLSRYHQTGEARIIGTAGREVVGRRKDGSLFPMELSVTSFELDGTRHFSGTIRDITDRKRAEAAAAVHIEALEHGNRAEARLKALVDGSVDGIITIDERGTMESFNRACERFFGYTEEEMLGQNLKVLMPPHYHDAHDTSFFRYLRTGEARVIGSSGVELMARRKDGTDFPIDLSVSVFSIDGRPHFSGIVRDITKKKQAEAEAARDTRALIRSNQSLDEFAYAASHDLRAPLRVIDNASKWLEEDLREHLTGENLENMQLLRGRIKRLEKLLDDMLEYSRIGRKSDEHYVTILAGDALVADVLSMVAVPETFQVVVSPAFAGIKVCRMPLQQVLMNLIGNAIKHHDKAAGRIELGVETGESMYTFTVRDDGPGIPAQFRERIFKMLETLQPKDRVEGSGMGLAMVRKHVEVFEGTVAAEAAEGRGSIFRFTWPIHQPQVQ